MFWGGAAFGKAPQRWNLAEAWCFALMPDIIARKSANEIVNELDWDVVMESTLGDGNLRGWAVYWSEL
eukprot:4068404-Alexandrium_andersonii.AAC.1